MNNSESRPGSTGSSSGSASGTPGYASNLVAQASDLAGEAATKVKQTASETVATVGGRVKQLLDQQLAGGASMIGHLASSAKRAGEELNSEAPQLASVVQAFAGRMDGYARDLEHQTVDQLLKGASDFTRRQPALMFGLAAVAGFFVLRTLKSTSTTVEAPPIQPSQVGQGKATSSLHGT